MRKRGGCMPSTPSTMIAGKSTRRFESSRPWSVSRVGADVADVEDGAAEERFALGPADEIVERALLGAASG